MTETYARIEVRPLDGALGADNYGGPTCVAAAEGAEVDPVSS